jgi:hypothetical protein
MRGTLSQLTTRGPLARVRAVRRTNTQPLWRLTCILCARSVEVDKPPARRRCAACGGYYIAEWNASWDDTP